MNKMENPYAKQGQWYFFTGEGDEYGPYKSKKKAEKALRGYVHWLDKGPTLWQRIWWPIRYNRLWHKA